MLTKEGMYTRPPLEELEKMTDGQLSQVEDFAVGHVGYGEVRSHAFTVGCAGWLVQGRRTHSGA